MSFKSVFRSLQEVFPQVDLRVLKAVAIEHSKDVDAAVEFILLEVLPTLGGSSEAPYTIHDTQEIGQSSTNEQSSYGSAPLEHQGVEEMNTSLLSDLNPVACRSAPSDDHTSPAHAESSCVTEALVEGSHIGYAIDPKEPSFSMSYHEVVKELNASLPSEDESHKDESLYFEHLYLAGTKAGSSVSAVYGGDNHDQVISNADNGDDGLIADVQELYGLKGKEAVSPIRYSAQNSTSFLEATPYLMEYGAVVEKDINSSVSECEELLQCSIVPTINQDLIGLEANGTISAASTSAENMSSSVIEKYPDFIDIGAEVQNNLNSSVTENEERQWACLVENCSDPSPPETNALDDSILSSTRSGHVVSIDFLEDFITDAKNNKKTLTSAMETVTDMMKEVEILEGSSAQTKEAVSVASEDVLTKVEELKQMLKHAKEANNMHAGEVYGERAILATEARELQSRLLSLSNDRNKSLSIIEEIRQSLEVRLAAAEEEIAAAELEKLEREELAHKALCEQEAIMNAVVEESKKLQEEAAENSKLRDFLMDRGRIVDVLQGEIAVICEDVLLLKERVAGRVPFGLSPQRSLSSSLASSSSSSSRKSTTSSERVLHPVELVESPGPIGNHERPETPQLSLSDGGKEVYAGGEQKVPSDDEWELCDTES